jgi:hypothetical protein
MDILFSIHSILRWVLLVEGVLVVVKFAANWLRQDPYSGLDRTLTAAFSGLMDLQALLGIFYLLWDGLAGASFPRFRLEHAFLMIVAAVLTHLPGRWQDADAPVRFRNTAFTFLISLILIVVGVSLLPGNRW